MTGEYLLGLLGLGLLVASVGLAGRTLRRALLPGWEGSPALLATGVLALAVLAAISELLGLFGLLDGPILVAACLIAGGGALRVERTMEPEGAGGVREAREGEPWERWAAVGFAFVVAAQWAGPSLLALDRGIYGGDSLWYHMPFAAHMAQSGSVTELLFTDPLYLNWLYPQLSELLHADGLLLFGNDFASPLLNLGWLAVALLAAWCIGRPYGAGAPAVAAMAALASANLLFSRQPGNANNDIVAIALLLASAAILVNARDATARGPLLVAGLAAGLALGTKLTVVPPIVALTFGVIAIAAAGERLRAAATWIAALVVGGGLWYLRDLFASGTPFPFVDIGPLNTPEELAGRDPYSIAHYFTDTDVWGRFFTPALGERLGDLWPLVLAAAVLGVVLWAWRADRVERMLALVALAGAVAYVFTPLSASGPEGSPVGFRLNIRYLAPALALALVLAAVPPPIVGSRERWWRMGAMALFAGLIAVNAGVLDGIDGDSVRGQRLLDTGRAPGSLLLAAAVVGFPVALVLLSRRGASRRALAAGAAAAAAALAVLGAIAHDDYLDTRYSAQAAEYPVDEQPSIELAQGLGPAYEWAREVTDAKVGLAGTTGALFQYGLWGPDASNEVRFIGEHRPRAAFEEFEDCAEWVEAVDAGGFDYVVTTPAYDQDDPESATRPVEALWIGAAGATRITPQPPVTLRGGEVANDAAIEGLVDVWSVEAPLEAAGCAAAPPRGEPTPGLPAD